MILNSYDIKTSSYKDKIKVNINIIITMYRIMQNRLCMEKSKMDRFEGLCNRMVKGIGSTPHN
jgi:hypothetical protein